MTFKVEIEKQTDLISTLVKQVEDVNRKIQKLEEKCIILEDEK